MNHVCSVHVHLGSPFGYLMHIICPIEQEIHAMVVDKQEQLDKITDVCLFSHGNNVIGIELHATTENKQLLQACSCIKLAKSLFKFYINKVHSSRSFLIAPSSALQMTADSQSSYKLVERTSSSNPMTNQNILLKKYTTPYPHGSR